MILPIPFTFVLKVSKFCRSHSRNFLIKPSQSSQKSSLEEIDANDKDVHTFLGCNWFPVHDFYIYVQLTYINNLFTQETSKSW